ncbi:RTA1 like protein-domain-containing protein [Mycena olivaceomarginata]|nr:RTA1 like protein-domain-containing protein [Mycena olivaceomarginata]
MSSVLLQSPYGYTPTESVCILFVVLFGISTALHLVQALRYRIWWILPTIVFSGLLETLGWSARLWSSMSVLQPHPFEIQLIVTICGPTPLAAANFTLLGAIILHLGPMYSRLTPKSYTIIFLICFLRIQTSSPFSVQGIGASVAAKAVINLMSPKKGSHIMLLGICHQLATIAVYTLCAGEFPLALPPHTTCSPSTTQHLTTGVPAAKSMTKRQKILIAGMYISTPSFHNGYLNDGFQGRIIQMEVYFTVLDGGMVTLAIFAFNFAHPGFLLYRVPEEKTHESKEGLEMKGRV